MEVREVDLTALALEVVAELRANQPELQIDFQIESGLRGWADERLMRLALANLFDNAAKFSDPGGEVSFAREDGVFVLKDQGIGFDMKYVDRLFRPFERLVRDTDFPGTGIGLANVKRIIERHHGRVWAESTPGNGATFFFTLPEGA
jgi:signal transduction histidine kinase